jgi:predicted MPP superfamily phosphohydrolase
MIIFHAYAVAGLVIAAIVLRVGRTDASRARILALIGAIALLATSVLLTKLVFHDAFATMRLISWSAFVHLPVLLAGSAVLARASWPRLSAAAGAVALAIVAIGVDAFFVEPRMLYVKHVTVESARVGEPLRIVVLADIQTDWVGDYERDALATAMAEEPDLVVLPGDYVQKETPEEYAEQAALFRQMILDSGIADAPLGAWAVQGNVEWPGVWQEALYEGTGVHAVAEDASVDLGAVTLTSLSFRSGFDTGLRVERPEGDDLHLVLSHGPDFALGDIDADVMIAGHTHGGQVQLPGIGPLITYSKVPRAWADDTTVFPDGRTLVVSRGVGMERRWAPRLRFFCRPQIVVVDVVPMGSSGDVAER